LGAHATISRSPTIHMVLPISLSERHAPVDPVIRRKNIARIFVINFCRRSFRRTDHVIGLVGSQVSPNATRSRCSLRITPATWGSAGRRMRHNRNYDRELISSGAAADETSKRAIDAATAWTSQVARFTILCQSVHPRLRLIALIQCVFRKRDLNFPDNPG
jgi:hypothetical protein